MKRGSRRQRRRFMSAVMGLMVVGPVIWQRLRTIPRAEWTAWVVRARQKWQKSWPKG